MRWPPRLRDPGNYVSLHSYSSHFNHLHYNPSPLIFPEEFAAHTSNVNCLALGHKSGRVLVTGGDDRKVNLWAVGKHNCIMVSVDATTDWNPSYVEFNAQFSYRTKTWRPALYLSRSYSTSPRAFEYVSLSVFWTIVHTGPSPDDETRVHQRFSKQNVGVLESDGRCSCKIAILCNEISNIQPKLHPYNYWSCKKNVKSEYFFQSQLESSWNRHFALFISARSELWLDRMSQFNGARYKLEKFGEGLEFRKYNAPKSTI